MNEISLILHKRRLRICQLYLSDWWIRMRYKRYEHMLKCILFDMLNNNLLHRLVGMTSSKHTPIILMKRPNFHDSKLKVKLTKTTFVVTDSRITKLFWMDKIHSYSFDLSKTTAFTSLFGENPKFSIILQMYQLSSFPTLN